MFKEKKIELKFPRETENGWKIQPRFIPIVSVYELCIAHTGQPHSSELIITSMNILTFERGSDLLHMHA